MVEFRPKLFIHVFPVTRYQLQRFIWTEAPQGFSPNRLFAAENPWSDSLWARGLSFDQAAMVADWLGGRLPTREEWTAALEDPSTPSLPERVRSSLKYAIDERLFMNLAPIVAGARSLAGLMPEDLGELVSERAQSPFGRISAMFVSGPPARLTGVDGRSRADRRFGFRCVIRGAQSH